MDPKEPTSLDDALQQASAEALHSGLEQAEDTHSMHSHEDGDSSIPSRNSGITLLNIKSHAEALMPVPTLAIATEETPRTSTWHLDNQKPPWQTRDIRAAVGTGVHEDVQLFSFAFNEIDSIRWFQNVLQFPALQVVNMSFNRITSLDGLEHMSPHVELLRCSVNKLKTLPRPAVWSKFTSLKELWLNRNKLINLVDTIESLAALPTLKRLVLVQNPCCKTSIDALYFHYIVASLPTLENLDGRKITEKDRVKGLNYISSPLGMNLVKQMREQGKENSGKHALERRPRSQPKATRPRHANAVKHSSQSTTSLVAPGKRDKHSERIMTGRREGNDSDQSVVKTPRLDTSESGCPFASTPRIIVAENGKGLDLQELDMTAADAYLVDQLTFEKDEDGDTVLNIPDSPTEETLNQTTRPSITTDEGIVPNSSRAESVGVSERQDTCGASNVKRKQSIRGFKPKEITAEESSKLSFGSIASMLPDFSTLGGTSQAKPSSRTSHAGTAHRQSLARKTNAKGGRVPRPPRRSEYRTTAYKSKAPATPPSPAAPPPPYPHELESQLPLAVQKENEPTALKTSTSHNRRIGGRSVVKAKVQTGARKKPASLKSKAAIAQAVKNPTPLPKSLNSWEGDAEKVVDFSTISKLLPDLVGKREGQIQWEREKRLKLLPKKKMTQEEKDREIFQSSYMRNKGRRKT